MRISIVVLYRTSAGRLETHVAMYHKGLALDLEQLETIVDRELVLAIQQAGPGAQILSLSHSILVLQ